MDSVVFIHGAWVTPACWRFFAPVFAEAGYRTLAPAWPFKDRPIADQLADPDPRLADVGIPEIVARYKAIIRNLPTPPMLIGHSFGGLIVQLLLDQGFGAAGIAINSVPPRGALFQLRSLPMAAVGALGKRCHGIAPPPKHCPSKASLVPESARIFRQLLTAHARVDFRNPRRAPLLLVGCGKDRCIPFTAQKRNWARYSNSPARTDFAAFSDLTHRSIAEPGYEALAAYCLAWTQDRVQPIAYRLPVAA